MSSASAPSGLEVSAHLPLSATDFHLLLVLQREGPLWGYALLEELAELSDGLVHPDIGSLYRILARLLAAGLLADAGEGEPLRGKRRKYYRITALGDAVLAAEARRLARAVELLRQSRVLPAT